MPERTARPVLWLDVETGGLNPHTHDLLTVGLYAPPAGALPPTEHLAMVSKGHYRATPEALSVNRLSLSRLREEGQSLREVDARLSDTVAELHHNERRLHLGGHNLDFDLSFLEAQLPRTHATLRNTGTLRRRVDTARLAVLLIDAGRMLTDRSSLEALCQEFGVRPGEHDAVQDARATAEVYAAMVRRVSDAGADDDR